MLEPDRAQEMVQRLSDFLRLTLKRSDEHWISFEDEWQYIQLYLSIEKVRFGNRLSIDADLAEQSVTWKIPTLIIQPLIENAIKYGLYGTTGNIVIHFATTVQPDMLIIRVANPFDKDSRPSSGNGFGLNGVGRRLYLLFGRTDLLQVNTTGSTFEVTIKIPTT